MIAVDTNLLIYAHREDSPHHKVASAVIRELATGRRPWAVPWPCVHEFLAVVTHPRIYQPATQMAVARAAVEALLQTPSMRLLGEGVDHWQIMTRLTRDNVVGPRVHDARIAAICLSHGIDALWSADRDFSWFPELTVTNPLAR